MNGNLANPKPRECLMIGKSVSFRNADEMSQGLSRRICLPKCRHAKRRFDPVVPPMPCSEAVNVDRDLGLIAWRVAMEKKSESEFGVARRRLIERDTRRFSADSPMIDWQLRSGRLFDSCSWYLSICGVMVLFRVILM